MAFITQKKFDTAIEAVNTKVEEAREMLEELRDTIQAEFDEKSEKWQEGEKGEAWKELLESLDEQIGVLQDAEGFEPERPE